MATTIAMFSTKTKKENYRLQLEFMNQTVDEQWRSIQQSQVCKCIQTIGDKVTMEPMELHTHVAALSVLKHSISQTIGSLLLYLLLSSATKDIRS